VPIGSDIALHCGITAPLLITAGLVSLLAETHIISVDIHLIWSFVLIGVGIAFLPEWRCASRSQ
jgi:hypothetical protein